MKELIGEEEYHKLLLARRPDRGIKEYLWNSLWIPLTHDGAGDHHCLDLDPSEGGTVGQIITWCHDDPHQDLLAPSFRSWLEDYAAKLESGEYVFSDYYDGIVTLEFLECSKKLDAQQE